MHKTLRGNLLPFLVSLVMLTATPSRAEEITVVDNVLGPEGPLYVDGNLYYVGWISNTLSKWDGKTSTVLNSLEGCSHNGLALTQRHTFLLACTDNHGAILELDLRGKQLRRWDADDKGRKFVGGINDVLVTANGGAYATVFGPPEDLPTEVAGKILYLAPGAKNWIEMARDLNKATSWWLGPDSMKIDVKGDMYVAQWFGGQILKISADGKLLHRFEIAAGQGTTNVAFGPGEKDLYVTVVKDPNDPKARGSIVKIPNL